jgi:hypothetical protein
MKLVTSSSKMRRKVFYVSSRRVIFSSIMVASLVPGKTPHLFILMRRDAEVIMIRWMYAK